MKRLIIPSLILLLTACAGKPSSDLSLYPNAMDQTVVISVVKGTDGVCEISPSEPQSDNNCKNALDNIDRCRGNKGCVCTRPGKIVTWKLNALEAMTFALIPKQGSRMPFKPSCDVISDNNQQIACKIRRLNNNHTIETFDYAIAVEGCSNFLDPRIIIGR